MASEALNLKQQVWDFGHAGEKTFLILTTSWQAGGGVVRFPFWKQPWNIEVR